MSPAKLQGMQQTVNTRRGNHDRQANFIEINAFPSKGLVKKLSDSFSASRGWVDKPTYGGEVSTQKCTPRKTLNPKRLIQTRVAEVEGQDRPDCVQTVRCTQAGCSE